MARVLRYDKLLWSLKKVEKDGKIDVQCAVFLTYSYS